MLSWSGLTGCQTRFRLDLGHTKMCPAYSVVRKIAVIAQALQGHHQVLQQQEDHIGAGKDLEASRSFPRDYLTCRTMLYRVVWEAPQRICWQRKLAQSSGQHKRSPLAAPQNSMQALAYAFLGGFMSGMPFWPLPCSTVREHIKLSSLCWP